ncbi:MAG: AbrB/MazE/SpoVT family DNA-binding domain-containing protein [Proteobacteria bacterium]|nr:AbrB/MazE/SpoVT family DNA-binding domain-containing protein [Pseudomonadota bacterium]
MSKIPGKRKKTTASDPLSKLRSDYDALVARMQTPQANAAFDRLFAASGTKLGATAKAQVMGTRDAGEEDRSARKRSGSKRGKNVRREAGTRKTREERRPVRIPDEVSTTALCKLVKSGKSLLVPLPAAIMKQLGWRVGDKVKWRWTGSKALVTKAVTGADLLARTPKAPALKRRLRMDLRR